MYVRITGGHRSSSKGFLATSSINTLRALTPSSSLHGTQRLVLAPPHSFKVPEFSSRVLVPRVSHVDVAQVPREIVSLNLDVTFGPLTDNHDITPHALDVVHIAEVLWRIAACDSHPALIAIILRVTARLGWTITVLVPCDCGLGRIESTV